MPKPNNRNRTRRSGLLIAGVSVLVLLGALFTLAAVKGWRSLSDVFASDKRDNHAGKVAVLAAPGPMQAFTQIDPAMFIDPKTGAFSVAWITEETQKEANYFRNPGQLRGRVLNHDKSAGLAFNEGDFYPKGTLGSPSAGVEPGYRGVPLDAKKIDGLDRWKRFDRIDLIAVINVRANVNANDASAVMSPEALAASQSAEQWKTERRTLVQNARIIVPVSTGRAPSSATEECLVAVREEECAGLADALAKGAKIVATVRSGLPGGDGAEVVDTRVTPPVDSIQVYSGKNSWRAIVPATKDEPAPATDDSAPAPK